MTMRFAFRITTLSLLRALGLTFVLFALHSAFRIPHSAFASPAVVPDSTTFVGANTPGPYWVTGFFIIAGSESISSSNNDSLGYSLDPNTGRIRFARNLTPADTVTVRFDRLGFALRSHWSLAPSQAGDRLADIVPISYSIPSSSPLSPLRSVALASRLEWQGYKSFSVTASDDAGTDWSQGMELAVQGELLEGLRLTAALSDRQVAAVSRYQSRDGSRLGDLDRFYVEAQSKQFYGRWGELRLDQAHGATRRVAGLRTEVHGSQQAFESYIARPQGEIRRTQITLREGELGPYRLSGSSAQASIVDGSQTVWLDGVKLAEGYDAEYTLDAVRGTLTLAPRVRFSRQSQLTVEYEESLDDFQRTMTGARWGWQSSDSTRRQSLGFAWEGDDPAQPLFGSLSSEQQDMLAHSADGQVTIPAIERVGDKNGDYNLTVGDEGDSSFVYSGPEQGEWSVRFQWVGEGNGRYRHLIDNVYEYVGAGLGHAEPILTLAAPRSQMTVDESLYLKARQFGTFSVNWLGLGVDPNRLSSGSSRFRSNHAISWALGDYSLGLVPHPKGGKSGIIGPTKSTPTQDGESSPPVTPTNAGVQLSWVRQEERSSTHDIGPTLARSNGDWRLRSELFDGRYDQVAVSAQAPLTPWLAVSTNTARLSTPSISGWRSEASTDLNPASWLLAQYHSQYRWLTDSASEVGGTGLHQALLRLSPRLATLEAGWREDRVDDPLQYFTYDSDSHRSRWLSLARSGIVARQEWRSSDLRAPDLDERSMESSLGLSAKSMHANSGSGLTVVRGERSVNGSSTPYYGGRLGATWALEENLQLTTNFDLSHRRAGSQREVVIPTRPGQGDYRLERGEYVSDPNGDYRRVFVDDAQDTRAAYDATKTVRVNWRPAWGGARWTFDASRRVEARYDESEFAPVTWVLPWDELEGALLPGGRLILRDDDRVGVQLRRQSRATLLFVQERQIARAASASTVDDHRNWRIESEWREELTRSAYVAIGTEYHRRTREVSTLAGIDSDARAALATFGYTPLAGLGLSVESRRRLDRDFIQKQDLGLWGIRPSARLNLGGLSGSLNADLTWLSGDHHGYLSPLLAEGRPIGFSITESAELRWQLPSRFSLNARVYGDHRPNEPDRWRMQLETVATF